MLMSVIISDGWPFCNESSMKLCYIRLTGSGRSFSGKLQWPKGGTDQNERPLNRSCSAGGERSGDVVFRSYGDVCVEQRFLRLLIIEQKIAQNMSRPVSLVKRPLINHEVD